MNKARDALATLLTWQLNTLCNTERDMDQQLEQFDHDMHLTQQKLDESCITPAQIVPEHAIASSHFMLLQHEHQHELSLKKQALQTEQAALNHQKIDLNTRLKRLEKHHALMLKNHVLQVALNEQNRIDEWILARMHSSSINPHQTLNGEHP